MKISNRWFKGLTTEDKEKLHQRLVANRDLFDILSRILNEKVEAIHKERLTKDNYFMPAWAEYQAQLNGSERAIKEIETLFPKEN